MAKVKLVEIALTAVATLIESAKSVVKFINNVVKLIKMKRSRKAVKPAC